MEHDGEKIIPLHAHDCHTKQKEWEPSVEVPLTKGKVALISASDAPLVLQTKWHAKLSGRRQEDWYAHGFRDGKKISMHRLIMKPTSGMQVDHINGNTLDNRRENLRNCTPSQNYCNKTKMYTNNKSGFRGIHWNKKDRQWKVTVTVDGVVHYLGLYEDKMEAVQVRDEAAKRLHGVFASLNNNEKSA